LTAADKAKDGPDPADPAPLSIFFATSSEAFFFAAASSTAFLFVATSLVVFFTVASLTTIFFTSASSAAIFLTAAPSVAFFFTTYSVTFFFSVASFAASLLRLHPQPLSLQWPLLPPPCHPQLSCRWTP
jgi:hypothetical protein